MLTNGSAGGVVTTSTESDPLENKIFIIGLPRTGTTSLSITLLSLGYRVAHTAYTQQAFHQAQVVSDTPTFCDYSALAKYYPNSRFIYLTRALPLWLPSIEQLLNRMFTNVTRTDGGFNPIIKRCYQKIFHPFTFENINNADFLSECYHQHQQQVHRFFSSNNEQHILASDHSRLLTLDLTEPNGFQKLLAFLGLPICEGEFVHANRAGKVTAWNDIKHPLKVASTRNGRVETLHYDHK